MRVRMTVLVFITTTLLATGAQAFPNPTTRHDPEGDVVDGVASWDIIGTTKKVRTGAEGRVWIAFTMHFAAPTEGGLLGGDVVLDTDNDHMTDARVSYSHWDNGSHPDHCSLRLHDPWKRIRGKAHLHVDRFVCLFHRESLRASAPVAWYVRSLAAGQTLALMDRAPDGGWYA